MTRMRLLEFAVGVQPYWRVGLSPRDENPAYLFVEMHKPNGEDAPFGFY